MLEKDGAVRSGNGRIGISYRTCFAHAVLAAVAIVQENDKEAEYYRIKGSRRGNGSLSKTNYLKETWTGQGKIFKSRARAAWLFEKCSKVGQQFSACSRNHVYEL